MKKWLLDNLPTVFIVGIVLLSLVLVSNHANSNEKTKAIIGHVVQTTINDENVDHSKLLEQELSNMSHQFALEMMSILQKHLPYIMDGVMTELRLELDKTHKCLLLKDSKIKDKDCGKNNN